MKSFTIERAISVRWCRSVCDVWYSAFRKARSQMLIFCEVAAVESACRRLGYGSRRMVSRAYHDSLYMARVCDVGMIFIPCRGGVSHRPDEYAAPEAIQRGVEVLALTLASLSAG